MRTTLPITLLAAAGLALGACGGDTSESGDASARAKGRDAALKFARCMRENGVDMPDPQVDENGMLVIVGGGPQPGQEQGGAASRRADERCRKYLDGLRPPKMSEEQQREFKEKALAHARCMREQGIDMPDPQTVEGGGVALDLGDGDGGLDPRSPAFMRAQKACSETLGGVPGPGGATP